ncbi:hypothetical protein Tco_0905374 [Tanacetum coccineum]
MFESGSYKSLPEHVALYEALKASMEHANMDEFLAEKDNSSKQKSVPHSEQPVEDVPIPDDVNISDLEDIDIAHLPKIKTRPDWLKPVLEEDRPETSEPDWIGKSKLSKADLEGLAYKIDLVNPKGNRLVPDVGKPLPIGGPPGQVTIQPQFFFNKDLEYLVTDSKERRSALPISKLKGAFYPDFGLEELVPSMWIKSEQEYDISAVYDITHCVIRLNTYERYGYHFLKETVLRKADYNEYKILEAGIKSLHPNDFEDLYLLHLQGQLNHLSDADKLHLFNAVNLWIRNIIIRKRVEDLQLEIEKDYTIVRKPSAVIYRDKNDQKKMMRETEVHKFSDGTLTRILEKLDYMVKDFKLFKYNPGMESKIWSKDDRRRSKDFMEVIERWLKIRSLESFVSGRLRDVDYRLISRTE